MPCVTGLTPIQPPLLNGEVWSRYYGLFSAHLLHFLNEQLILHLLIKRNSSMAADIGYLVTVLLAVNT